LLYYVSHGGVCREVFVVFGVGGALPFRFAEIRTRKRSSIRSSVQEFRWLVIEMVFFCSSRRELLLVRLLEGAIH